MTSTTYEIIWLLTLLSNFCISHAQSAQLFCDNQAALQIVANPIFHEYTKHIGLDCHFRQDKIQVELNQDISSCLSTSTC